MRDLDRSCTGKDAFPTKEEAHRRIVALVRDRGVVGVRAYICLHCRRWHVGHQPSKPRTLRTRKKAASSQARAKPK